MSALAILIAIAIAALATLLYALATDSWGPRPLAGMFLFGLVLLLVPGLVH